jgi:hypothetical protein
MPQVLTTNAVILCPHLGQGTSAPTDPKWVVNGGVVLLENDLGVLACPFLVYPCVGYRLRSMGLNATRIDGRKVILATDFNQTFTGLPLTMAEAHSTLDGSTPAAVPAGQPAPPLSPALADMTPPVVTGAPPALAFNLTSMQPATLAATFTLVGAHPLKWILTLISEPLASHVDLTGGLPPGLVVAPAGGAWNSSPLTVTVTMTAAYMAGLTAGRHHFYMAGISQRGLSAFKAITLTVS